MDGWLTTDEAQTVTGLSRSSLYIYRLTGKIRTTTVGRTRLFYADDCEQIAREKAIEGETPDQKESNQEGGTR